jgi:hypothetical protein
VRRSSFFVLRTQSLKYFGNLLVAQHLLSHNRIREASTDFCKSSKKLIYGVGAGNEQFLSGWGMNVHALEIPLFK